MAAPKRFTLDDLIDAVRTYVRDNHPGVRAEDLRLRLTGGAKIQLPIPESTVAEIAHSPDYREVSWYGATYHFSATQAAVVKILHEAYGQGTPEVGTAALLEGAGSQSSSPRDLFRRHPAWADGVIGPGERRGTWRLYGPDDAPDAG